MPESIRALLLLHFKLSIQQPFGVQLTSRFQRRQHVIPVKTDDRQTVTGPHSHLSNRLFKIVQTFDSAQAGAARTGCQKTRLPAQIAVMPCLAPAQPVDKRLHTFSKVVPVHSRDPNNPIGLHQLFIEVCKIILQDAGPLCTAQAPAIAAGAAVGFYWRRIKRAVRGKKMKEKDYDDEDEDDEDE